MPPDYFFSSFAFVVGAIVGSFLNVCIYRMPRDLSVNKPRRSFCPSCQRMIPWFENVPILSWLLLGGKCAKCKASIPPRYLMVEMLTGALFLAVWLKFPWILAFPYWLFLSLLIVATFIDFEFYIIPNEITWGGTIAGILLSVAIPTVHQTNSPVAGLAWSVVGAATGFLTLLTVVKLGKLAFGRKVVQFAKPVEFTWTGIGEPPEKDAELIIDGKKTMWSDYFVEKEQVNLDCEMLQVDGKEFSNTPALMTVEFAEVEGTRLNLDQVNKMSGLIRSITFRREAMGFGDVAFITAIGAFLGWKGVFFTIFASSVVGSIVGVASIVFNRREWSGKVPFGPYLSLGAVLWMFYGQQVVDWYVALMRRGV